MYRTKAIYQLSDLKKSSWKILRLFEIYRQSGSQAPVCMKMQNMNFSQSAYKSLFWAFHLSGHFLGISNDSNEHFQFFHLYLF